MSKNRKQHLELARDNALKVLTESALVIVILVCCFAIHAIAEWLFAERAPSQERTKTTITIHGVSGVPRPGSESFEIKTIEEHYKESK